MSEFHGPEGERLRLREGRACEVEGTVEVVYADSWDDLAEVAGATMSEIPPELRAEMRAGAAKDDREWGWYQEHVPLLLDALEAAEAQRDVGAAILAQALANNPIRRDLIVRAYALLKGLETP